MKMSFWKPCWTLQKLIKIFPCFLLVLTIVQLNQMSYSISNHLSDSKLQIEQQIIDEDAKFQRPNLLSKKFHQNGQNYQTETWKNKIKVLCWIMTQPIYHEERAVHIKNTWGKRCDKLLFISSINDVNLPSIGLAVNDSYEMIWGKTKAAFKYIYDNYINDYTWFMKADDDTYVVLENLRFFLKMYEPDEDAIYFGHKYKLSPNHGGFMDGGGGYVLSRKALKLFIEKALPNPTLCRQDNNTHREDFEMGQCLANVGVIAGDTRDGSKRGTFFHFNPGIHLMSGLVPVEHQGYSYYPIKNGTDCCSNLAISFHWVEPIMMYELDYLIYHLHPYGIQYSDPDLPPLPPDKDSVPRRVINSKSIISQSSVG